MEAQIFLVKWEKIDPVSYNEGYQFKIDNSLDDSQLYISIFVWTSNTKKILSQILESVEVWLRNNKPGHQPRKT